jgi:phospholipid/cholesterol/gamma-HCH transport system permease protein
MTRGAILQPMAARADAFPELLSTRTEGDELIVSLRGRWVVTGPRPAWADVRGDRWPVQIRPVIDELETWDSSLLLFFLEIRTWCHTSGARFEERDLPARMRQLLVQLEEVEPESIPKDRAEDPLTAVGLATFDAGRKVRGIYSFVGECVLSALHVIRLPRLFRWRDCLGEMQACGAMALPIVSLISFLVGVTLAYTGAIVLRQYGGDIYVADLIGLAMVREMGAVMTGIVLAGRTGAAFAAVLGNMKMNEEVDALETLGVSPVDFLVLPRMVALAVMMPLLTLYANALGILGGMAIALGTLGIPPAAFWVEMLTIVDLSDTAVGVIKGITFGLIVGLAGCLRGLQADRSAAGVGQAATSAVVTAILLIIVADAAYAVIFNILGL